LDREYFFKELITHTREEMEKIKDLFLAAKIMVRIGG
jgi:predicted DNA-binding protein